MFEQLLRAVALAFRQTYITWLFEPEKRNADRASLEKKLADLELNTGALKDHLAILKKVETKVDAMTNEELENLRVRCESLKTEEFLNFFKEFLQ